MLMREGRTRRWLLRGCLLGLGSAVCAELGHVIVGCNFHTVVPGKVYRSAQPTPASLTRAATDQGIRTVVNLRGTCDAYSWFLEEAAATQRLGLAQEDLCFSSYRLPSVHELKLLVEVFDRSEKPLLIHCRRGSDRTGLACAVYLLSQGETSLAEARRQLHWRYGHLALGRTRHLTTFFDLYEEWLHAQGQPHCRAAFRDWVASGYCAGACRARLEPLGFPASIPLGKPMVLRVRATNLGVKPWQLKPENNAGIHLGYVVIDESHQLIRHDRGGLFSALVQPGESVDLPVLLPGARKPGKWTLWIDMVDEQHCWFYQAGSEPLEWELEVR